MALGVNGPVFLWWASSSSSFGLPLHGQELHIFPWVIALLLAAAALLLLLPRRTRSAGAALLAGSAIYAFAAPLALIGGNAIRMSGFERFAERSKPLTDAIRNYDAAHGRPPETLDALVPEFLAAVPGTGMRASPEYEYFRFEREGPRRSDGGDRWMLRVDVGTGFLNWDVLVYLPSGDYPDTGWGGWLEPVGSWAYVHE